MDRRAFLKGMSVGAAALAANGFAIDLLASAASPAGLKNWVWITPDVNRTDDDWKRTFALMKQSGIHAIVPEVYTGRMAFYASERLPVKADWLGRILPLARAEGLEVHAWIVCMLCSIDEMVKKHPDWYNVNAKGESAADKPAYVDYYKFLDPGRPEVREWVQGTVKELANIPELDGVHLDYIRHPDAILPSGLWKKYNIVQDKVYPAYDYGYTRYERDEFKKRYGIDPIEIKDPTSHKEWMQFRLDMVTGLVNGYLVPAARAKGKKITAAVFPGPSMARDMVRQDWGQWDLDGFLPMLYHSFYQAGPEWVKQQTAEGVAAAKKPIYSGLFVHDTDEATFTKTVEKSLEGGASGVSIFSLRAMNEAKWKALQTVMQARLK